MIEVLLEIGAVLMGASVGALLLGWALWRSGGFTRWGW